MLIPAIVVSNTCSKVPAYLDTSVDVPNDNQYSNTQCIIRTDFLSNSLSVEIIIHSLLYKEPLYKESTCRRQKYFKNLYQTSNRLLNMLVSIASLSIFRLYCLRLYFQSIVYIFIAVNML